MNTHIKALCENMHMDRHGLLRSNAALEDKLIKNGSWVTHSQYCNLILKEALTQVEKHLRGSRASFRCCFKNAKGKNLVEWKIHFHHYKKFYHDTRWQKKKRTVKCEEQLKETESPKFWLRVRNACPSGKTELLFCTSPPPSCATKLLSNKKLAFAFQTQACPSLKRGRRWVTLGKSL